MIRPIALSIISLLGLAAAVYSSARPADERDRSPMDLAVSKDGAWAITANSTSDSASLVDLNAGTVIAEIAVGKRPFCVALAGNRAVVTNWLSNTATVLDVAPPALKVVKTIPLGEEPRGVAITPDGSRAYVALAGEDSVAEVDIAAGKIIARIPVGIEPWQVALTPDNSRLIVGNARSMDVSVIDLKTRTVDHTVKLRGRNVRHIAVAPAGDWAYVPHDSERGRPVNKENIDLGWVYGSRLSRCPIKESGPREAIALDPRGDAVGDVDGVTIGPDGESIVLSAGGTHELLYFHLPLPFVAYGGPGDHMEFDLRQNPARFHRIPVGGRPMGVRFIGPGRVVSANYLSNSVQIVNVESGKIEKTIPLGGPATPSLARKGEAIFYDARRSFNHWYSCGSCHVEGHTNGSNFDTFNDGSYDTPKKTLSLRGVTRTAPWTWHGWRKDLKQLVHDSMTKSMQGPEPADSDVDAVIAYLGTLDFRPRGAESASAKRGEAVFNAKGCIACHAPPDYTSPGVYTVGLESATDVYKGFNPPPLRGVGSRAPYLHDGRATTLEEVLTQHHRPSALSGKPDCSPGELTDLIAFLRSL